MARMPCSQIPGVSGNNFISSQATPSFQRSDVAPPSVDFQHVNNPNFLQTLASNSSNQTVLQQSGDRFRAPGTCFNVPRYIQYPGWPPLFNQPPPFFVTQQRLGQQDVQSLGCVPHFNAAIPQRNDTFGTQQWTRIEGGGDSLEVHKEDGASDESWVESWLQCRSQGRLQPQSSVISARKSKVWEVKKLLQDCWILLSELDTIEGELSCCSKDISEIYWSAKLKDFNLKKGLFEKSFRMIDETPLKEIKKVLVKRNKKRGRKRKRHHLEKEIAAKMFENRKKLRLEIDIWLEKQKADVEMLKQEESMKQEADAVLWGVRRKQSEGRKILSLLSALVKLHHFRSKKNQASSMPSEDAEQFLKIIDKLVELWEGQMKEYEAEEKTLRVMLEENPEKSKGRDEMKLSLSKLERSNREWEVNLFGELSLNVFQPSLSRAALIETRSYWDQYISFSRCLASSIPIGWVIPTEASSKEWKENRK